ncbi:MAG: hypothetical protein AB8B93_10345 [Pseudomonadales bacterium]
MIRLIMATGILAFAGFFGAEAVAESPHPFVPDSFTAPAVMETPKYRLRTLTVNDVVKDYDAVMSSASHIKEVGPGSHWPTDLTLEQNLIDLGWHQKEFQESRSFAYTVVDLDESRVIGCVYINPTRKVGFDAVVTLWTRPPEQVSYINEDILREAVQQWLKKEWPFKAPAFPGSDISWQEWSALAESKR